MALGHLRQHEVGQPDDPFYVGRERLLHRLIGDGGQGSIVRVRSRIADQDIDSAPMSKRRVNEPFQILLARNVARMHERFSTLPADSDSDLFASIGLA